MRLCCGPRFNVAEIRQQLHASTEAEFVALAGFNLAVGLKCNQPVRVVEPPEIPPLAISLADCLQTAVRERREFNVVQRTVEMAVQGGRVARADFAPKVIADGTLLDFLQQYKTAALIFAWGSSGSSGRFSRVGGGSPRLALPSPRCARPWPRPSPSPIISRSRSTKPTAAPSQPGSASTIPARQWIKRERIIRLVQLRLREGAATPTEIADAQASLTRCPAEFLNARYNYLIAMDRLEYAMGVGRTPMALDPIHRLAGTSSQSMGATHEYNPNRPRLLRAMNPAATRPRPSPSVESPSSVSSRSALALAGWSLARRGLPVLMSWIEYRRTHSITDDVFVEAHIVNVAPQLVSGRLMRYHVDENDQVVQGQVVAEIDPIPYRIRSTSPGSARRRRKPNWPASEPTWTGSARSADTDRDRPTHVRRCRSRPGQGRGIASS